MQMTGRTSCMQTEKAASSMYLQLRFYPSPLSCPHQKKKTKINRNEIGSNMRQYFLFDVKFEALFTELVDQEPVYMRS